MHVLVAEPGQDIADALKLALAQHVWVVVPAGTFLVSAPIEAPSGRRLSGYGRTLTTLRAADGTLRPVLDCTDTEDVTIGSLGIELDATMNFRQAIQGEGSAGLTVRDCWLRDVGPSQDGWTTMLVAARNASRIRVEDCELDGGQVKLGGPTGGVSDARVEGCTIRGAHNFGISCVTVGEQESVDVHIVGNTIDDPYAGGIYVGSDSDQDTGGRLRRMHVRGNTVTVRRAQCGGIFFRVGRSAEDVEITANTVTYEGDAEYGGSRGIQIKPTDDDHTFGDYEGARRLAVQANTVSRFDLHSVFVVGRVEGLTWCGNTSAGGRGTLIRARNGDITGAIVGGYMAPRHPAYPSIDLYAESGDVAIALAGVLAPNGVSERAEPGFSVSVT